MPAYPNKKPKMIVFDYGHTLIYEPDFNALRGDRALFRYIKRNKNNLTPEQVGDFTGKFFGGTHAARSLGLEFHEWQFQRLLYEYLEIELTISIPEAEKVFWDNASAGAVMPGADGMLDCVNACGIRSGIISNIMFSGAALTDRLNRLLPRNKFEFVLASSEYMIRKPNPMLFELALKKAELDAADVWFCGDNAKADIEGAAAVGMFPVWYECKSLENIWMREEDRVMPQCDYLHIRDWNELIRIISGF